MNLSKKVLMMGLAATIAISYGFPGASTAYAQESSPEISLPAKPNVFAGNWTYRSFISNSDQSIPPNNLLFGMADIVLQEAADGGLSGTLGGAGWSLVVTGKATYSADSVTAKFQGVGDIGGEQWVYDYFGYASPIWKNGINQVPTFTGTVVRTAPHGGAPAGLVASFIAVRKSP